MSLFGRLLGTDRPELPAGARYIIDGDGAGGGFVIKLVLAGQDTGDFNLKRVGPHFTDLAEAGQYREWLSGSGDFSYPAGKV